MTSTTIDRLSAGAFAAAAFGATFLGYAQAQDIGSLGETVVESAPAPAAAAPAPAPAPQPTYTPPPPVEAPRPNVSNEPVIVTQPEPEVLVGEQINRTIVETTNSVEVLDGADLASQNITTITEAIDRTPGVSLVGKDFGYSIRGVRGFPDGIGAGNAFRPTIAVIRDGVSLDRLDIRVDPLQTWDVKQVEVLRGGQSLNIGKSAVAGAIVIETNDPVLEETEFNMEQGIYSDNGTSTLGTINIPIGDNAAFRFSGGYIKDDGTIDNLTLGRDVDELDSKFWRGKFLIDNGTGVRALTSYSFNDTFKSADLVNSANPGARVDFSNDYGFEEVETHALSQLFEIEVNDAWTMDTRFTYYDSKYGRQDDFDGTAAPFGTLIAGETSEEFTGEVRFKYDEGTRLRGQIGAYYSDRDLTVDFNTVGLDQSFTDLGPNLNRAIGFPLFTPAPGNIVLDLDTDIESKFKNYAFFGEVEYDVANDLIFRAGLRYDNVDTDQFTNTVYGWTSPATFNAGVPALQGAFPGGVGQENTNFGVLLPSASLTYKFDDDTSLSALYKESYRSGGVEVDFSGFAGSNGINTFDPEYTKTYELAYRAEDVGDFDIAANLYYTQWEDQQIAISTQNPLVLTSNAGESNQYGFEGLVEYTPSDSLQLYASVALAETEFDQFIDGANNFAGNSFPFAPETSFGVGATTILTDNLYFNVNANYQSDSFVGPQNTAINDARTVVNAALTYDVGSWYATIWSSNIGDELYITNRGASPAGQVQVGDPRIIGVKAGFRF